MRIVDYKTFTNMPNGVIYQEYEPCIFGDIKVRHDVLIHDDDGLVNDWYYSELFGSPDLDHTKSWSIMEACEVMENGKSIPIDVDITSRDGIFAYERKFLIYEKSDIELIVNKLSELKNRL
jgi:hypothetical protein